MYLSQTTVASSMSLIGRLAFACMLAIWLAGCGNDSNDPEQQLRDTIDAVQNAAEDRDLSDLVAFIDSSYEDKEGRQLKDIKAIAQLQFLRYPSIHTFKIIKKLTMHSDSHASVRILVAMAGRPIGDAASLSGMRADMISFELEFKFSDTWKMTAAEWHPAGQQDFL